MHIALYHDAVIPPPSYGGTERVIAWLARGLLALGHEVTLLARQGSQLPGVELVSLNDSNRHRWQELIPAGVDILHLHATPRAVPKLPFLVTIHGNGQPGEAFHPNSVFVSERHARNHGSIRFVHNGLDLADYDCVDRREDYLVFLAKASWSVKNLTGAISVARSAGRELLVMGSRDWPFHLQRRLPAWRGVRYLGMVRQEEKRRLLSRAHGLVFPVRWHEPFGLAVTEALASGAPVFGTPYGSLPELVSGSVGCLSTEAEILASAIRSQHYLPSVCRRRVEQGLTHLDMAKSYLRLYAEVREKGHLATEAPRAREERARLLPWN